MPIRQVGQCPKVLVRKKLKAKLLISPGRLWHENVHIGDFRVSDVPMSAASGTIVRTGMTSGFQAASGVTKLRFLSSCRQGGNQHDGHAAGNAQKHGKFAAKEVVVVQKIASHAYVHQSLVR